MQTKRAATIPRQDFGEPLGLSSGRRLSRAAQYAVVAVVAALILLLAASSALAGPQERQAADNPNPPSQTVKLIFIHHSTGENWLADEDGGLGLALRDNNIFVSDTNYDWGPDSIGDTTDIGHWWTWFRGPRSGTYTAALYAEYGQHSWYSRLPTDPGGQNEIIMFKSCFPNSHLGGNPDDPPTTGDNPLRGQDAWSEHMTVANAKGIYNDILEYFATRQDKLFVVITAPPLMQSETDASHAANARAFNDWLVNDWLNGYEHNNVAVFDFYNVLTSNGGNPNTNDLGWATGNHHRWWNGAVQHIQTVANNFAAYGSDAWDSHPTAAGNQKASGEFVPLLNVFYHRWKGDGETPTPTATGTVSTATPTHTPTLTRSPTPTGTPPSGQQTMIFQDGVSPDPSYAGTTDVILANDEDNVAPNANLGGAENLETFFGEEEHRRSLMRWNLSALPGDATISSATVELYRYDGDAESDMPVALYRVTREWTEGTGWDFRPAPSYVPDGATWTLASPGTTWTTAGGDYDATSVSQITLPATLANGWIQLDATAAVRAWIEQGVPNHGLLLRPLSGEYTYHYYYSRNHPTANQRPRLVVTYTVGGTATATPTSTQTVSPTPTPTPTASATPVAPDLPDLIVNSMKIELETGGDCDYTSTQLGVRVWLENIGGGDACPFVVDVNGSQQDISSGLAAGQITSTWFVDSFIWPGENTAYADATFLVEESNEDNNQLAQFLPIPTLPPTCTSTPTPAHWIYLPLILKGWSAPVPTPTPTLTLTPTPTTVVPSGLVQPSDLVYRGGFAYPPGDEWAYSGHALAYYPEGDPTGQADGHPGSLYAAGHTWDDLAGEITIPEPAIADNFADLPEASVLQSLADITGGWKDNCTYNDECLYREVDGLEYLPNINKIVWNLRDWYNTAAYDQDSLGWSDLDMTGAQGVWHIGERPSDNDVFHNAKACNYLFKAPENFADENLGGKWLIAGNHREAGALGGSQGPTLYALAPWENGNPPESGQNLDALALLYYPEIYDCVWEAPGDINENPEPGVCHFPGYRAMDNWGGGAWVQTATRSGVLIFGRKGLGDNCYGTQEECGGDPCLPSKGYHAYPYEPQILFYDPGELKEVIAGTREPWEVLPYEVYSPVDEVFDQECAILGAAAYDRERGLIYVTEQEAGPWGETVVHVWEVRGDTL